MRVRFVKQIGLARVLDSHAASMVILAPVVEEDKTQIR